MKSCMFFFQKFKCQFIFAASYHSEVGYMTFLAHYTTSNNYKDFDNVKRKKNSLKISPFISTMIYAKFKNHALAFGTPDRIGFFF